MDLLDRIIEFGDPTGENITSIPTQLKDDDDVIIEADPPFSVLTVPMYQYIKGIDNIPEVLIFEWFKKQINVDFGTDTMLARGHKDTQTVFFIRPPNRHSNVLDRKYVVAAKKSIIDKINIGLEELAKALQERIDGNE